MLRGSDAWHVAGGLLKIEDILPFFPDFATIDNFRDAICDSLARHNRQIEDLRRDMDEATDIAEAVRHDLKTVQVGVTCCCVYFVTT